MFILSFYPPPPFAETAPNTSEPQDPKTDIADLYHKRWHVELDIRNIKQTLKMDVLSCKSPEMVRKEIWTHLLAYNLVRKVMAQAALEAKTEPRRISFAGAVQTLNAFRWVLLLSSRTERGGQLVRMVLLAIATHVVGDRPGRCEPRKVKRRPKAYPLMTKLLGAGPQVQKLLEMTKLDSVFENFTDMETAVSSF